MLANVLPADPYPTLPLTLRWGHKVYIQLFLKHGHFVYQIKYNHECSNIIENILPVFFSSVEPFNQDWIWFSMHPQGGGHFDIFVYT